MLCTLLYNLVLQQCPHVVELCFGVEADHEHGHSEHHHVQADQELGEVW